jgi:hypothetical protein
MLTNIAYLGHIKLTYSNKLKKSKQLMQDHVGDPITAKVIDEKGNKMTTKLYDNELEAFYNKGTFFMKVKNVDRPIKDCPLFFEVTNHNS